MTIGMLDWGIGGLSVYKALRERGSTADVLYFSDSGTCPYGKLAREELRARLAKIAVWFQQRHISRVLVACHAASSALAPDPVSGVEVFGGVAFQGIIPAVRRAVARSTARRIGVIGGVLTIQSKVYERALVGLERHFEYHSAQPLSAYVESGELDTPAVKEAVARLLGQFNSIEALLMACTHYPALKPVFQRIAPDLELLDPGAEMAETVQETGSNHLEFFTTGQRTDSIRVARLAFGIALPADCTCAQPPA